MAEPSPIEPYVDARQQYDAAMMGMYVFLASEIMLFGGLFVAAGSLRLLHESEIVAASRVLHTGLAGINTAVLLTSSVFVALGVESVRGRERRRSAAFLIAAALCGIGFLVIKLVEYRLEADEKLLPLPGLATAYGSTAQQRFMDLYLVATSLHAVHLVVGIILLALVALRIWRGGIALSARVAIPVVAGLYWHLVDVIWVFLYPVFYLAR